MNIVNLRGKTIFTQLKYEEILLRYTKDNWFLFNSQIPEVAIVLGFSGKIDELVNKDKASTDNIQLIRRYTGGGTVVVDANTIFTTFVMNSEDASCFPFPRNIMNWSEMMFAPVFNNVNAKFSLRENDYIINTDRKVGGNAQSITKNRWVHHTSWLHEFRKENMTYLLLPKKRPEYRQNRSHEDFLTTLSEYFSSPAEFEDKIILSIKENYNTDIIHPDAFDQLIATILDNQNNEIDIRTKLENY